MSRRNIEVLIVAYNISCCARVSLSTVAVFFFFGAQIGQKTHTRTHKYSTEILFCIFQYLVSSQQLVEVDIGSSQWLVAVQYLVEVHIFYQYSRHYLVEVELNNNEIQIYFNQVLKEKNRFLLKQKTYLVEIDLHYIFNCT